MRGGSAGDGSRSRVRANEGNGSRGRPLNPCLRETALFHDKIDDGL